MPLVLPVLVLLAVAVAALLYAFVLFDRLVRAEYSSDRRSWEADGRPHGFLWRAPESTWFRRSLATPRLSLAWVFKTPAWAAASPTHRRLLRRFRICVLAWNAILVGLLLLVLVAL